MDEFVKFGLVFLTLNFGTEANRAGFAEAFGNYIINADKGTADDKEDVFRIHFDGGGFGMFALAAGGEFHDTAFEHL